MAPEKQREKGKQPSSALIRFVESSLARDGLMWEELAGEGSGRQFYRVRLGKESWVVMVNPSPLGDRRGITENDSFLYIARHLRKAGIPVPEIYEHAMEPGWFLMEDMGDCHLQTAVLSRAGDLRRLVETYQRVIDVLTAVQVEGRKDFDPGRTHNPSYDEQFMLAWESGYFFKSFVQGYLGLAIPEEEVRDEFADLAHRAAEAPGGYFLYRDFQSRNIMVREGEGGLGLLDFQGGRLGPLPYDLASLLLDPYVDLEQGVQEELFAYYLARIEERLPLNAAAFREQYAFVALHRALQIIGAFAFLTRERGLAFFQTYIPAAVRGLRRLMAGDKRFAPYQRLKHVVFEEITGI
jgi:aminoglycoside/choline kinase family phosphotransferase